jgi:hypothetical protein
LLGGLRTSTIPICDFVTVKMPNMDKKWFKAKGNIDKELAKKLLTLSFGAPVTDTLSRFNWDGKLVATVGLEFTPDNRRVLRGQFLLHGLFIPGVHPRRPRIPFQRRLAEYRPNGVREFQAPFLQGGPHHLPHGLGSQQNR